MTRMLQDIKDRDKYRGTCLIDLFPEWKKYYENFDEFVALWMTETSNNPKTFVVSSSLS